jgi:phage terminase small subunit
MGLPKKLTEMQIRFAHLLIDSPGKMTATECAIAAGYSPEAAVVSASKLQNPKTYPLVVNYINSLREQRRIDIKLSLDKNLHRFNILFEDILNKLEQDKFNTKGIYESCKTLKPLIDVFSEIYNSDKSIKVYLAEEQRPYITNHYKIGKTLKDNIEERRSFTDNPYGLNYVQYIEYKPNKGFNLEKSLHNFFKKYSTKRKDYNGSTEWFYFKNKKSILKNFLKASEILLKRNNCEYIIK